MIYTTWGKRTTKLHEEIVNKIFNAFVLQYKMGINGKATK